MITVIAQVNKITTTIDGGWRISFDVDDSQKQFLTELAALRGYNLELSVKLDDSELNISNP